MKDYFIKIGNLQIHNKYQWDLDYKPLVCFHWNYDYGNGCKRLFVIPIISQISYRLQRQFNQWNQLGCPKCGCKKKHIGHCDYLDTTLVEYEELCDNCETVVGNWAYGNFQPPTTKIEYFKIITLVQWGLWWKEWLKIKY